MGSRLRQILFRPRVEDDRPDGQLPPPYLLVGLGNPGREYRDTRHNVGFMVIDRMAEQLGVRMTRVQHKALTAAGVIEGKRVILAKPQTYMNLSGESVSGLARFYKIPLSQLIVINDELDLPFGMLRLRPGGGSAGQKGMQSIIDRLGSQDFPRLRIGIGRPAGSKQGAGYVLKGFSPLERKELDYILERASQALKTFVTAGLDTAMNQYNGSQLEE